MEEQKLVELKFPKAEDVPVLGEHAARVRNILVSALNERAEKVAQATGGPALYPVFIEKALGDSDWEKEGLAAFVSEVKALGWTVTVDKWPVPSDFHPHKLIVVTRTASAPAKG